MDYRACIRILGIQAICHLNSLDMGYYPFYFQGYGILCSIYLFTFRGIEYLGTIYGDICQFIRDT